MIELNGDRGATGKPIRTLDFQGLAKEVGLRWKNIDGETKTKYEAKAKKNREEYSIELAEFRYRKYGLGEKPKSLMEKEAVSKKDSEQVTASTKEDVGSPAQEEGSDSSEMDASEEADDSAQGQGDEVDGDEDESDDEDDASENEDTQEHGEEGTPRANYYYYRNTDDDNLAAEPMDEIEEEVKGHQKDEEANDNKEEEALVF